MLNEEVKKYRELSGDTNPNTSISRIGGYLDGYEKALEQTRWIPVNERLPEDGKQVLCCNKYGSVFTSELTWSKGYLMFGRHYDVIAWMPLPEPYQEGKKKNERN